MTEQATEAREVSYAEYLAMEERSEIKHEWIDGVVYAMSGGTLAHNQLSAQMIGELLRLIGERPCRVFTSDQRARPRTVRLAAYPDVTVVCGEPIVHEEDHNAVVNPLVLVEVLSDSTESWDRAGKFRRYRKIESLKHYVLVSQHERCIEVYSRDAEGGWVLREGAEGEWVALDALGGALEVDRVYRNVTLTPDARASE
ncbi:MAG: Uma2 family endonuclease [Polyangiales bacterium]